MTTEGDAPRRFSRLFRPAREEAGRGFRLIQMSDRVLDQARFMGFTPETIADLLSYMDKLTQKANETANRSRVTPVQA